MGRPGRGHREEIDLPGTGTGGQDFSGRKLFKCFFLDVV